MVLQSADNTNPRSLAARLRQRRMQLFWKLLAEFSEPVHILDGGGTAGFWQQHHSQLPQSCHITLLNLTTIDTGLQPNMEAIAGDVRSLGRFADQAVHIFFSNSVIEHVGTFADQMAMAHEVQRVAQAYFVQTPNRYFPMEPHFLVPLWQFMPRFLRVWLHSTFNLGWMPKQAEPLLAQAEVEQIRLLNVHEMRRLFPRARIHREKLAGLTKSIIAVGHRMPSHA